MKFFSVFRFRLALRKPLSCFVMLALAILAEFLIVASAAAQDASGGRIRVQIVSRQQTTLSSEIEAKISVLTLREGNSFQEGQTLIAFDCSIQEAQLHKAKAVAEAAHQTLKVNARLAELGSISTLEMDQSKAKVKEAEADLAVMTAVVSKCSLKAPFTGRVAKLYVEKHQYLAPGKPIMDILDTTQMEARAIVPSSWLKWIRQDSRFSVRIDELGRSFPARVIRLGAKIDPLSQTVSIAGLIEGAHSSLLPGMSGWASFQRGKP